MTDDVRDGFFATPDGPKVHYRDYAPHGGGSGGDAGGPPVLCLHGLTRNVRDFEELAPRIAALGRRVIVASQRGRGRSDPDPNADRYTPATYVADMFGLLDQIGVARAVFVGTSMGGLMTMIAAAREPQRLAGAVINDIGPELDPKGLERIRGYVAVTTPAAQWAEAAARCRAINGVAFPKETSEAFWVSFARKIFREEAPDRIVLDYDPAIARTVAEDSGDLADLWPLFDALKPIPTLVVRGAITDILMASTLEEMRRRKPDLEAVAVADVGHAPFMTEPDAWPALSAFIRARV